jgi:hypothetical protein
VELVPISSLLFAFCSSLADQGQEPRYPPRRLSRTQFPTRSVIQNAFRQNAETETVTTGDTVFQNLESHEAILKLNLSVLVGFWEKGSYRINPNIDGLLFVQ